MALLSVYGRRRATWRTVDRVLPWRRHSPPAAEEVAPARRRLPRPPPEGAHRPRSCGPSRSPPSAHEGQYRQSGEKYINHPLAVARIVADIGLDDTTLAAALLHDAVEDTEVSVADVDRQFGSEIAAIVDGVTKLDRLRFDSKEEQQAATMRKMLVAMAKDLRVLIIKLADRLHNMRTLAALGGREAGRASPRRRSTSTPRSPTGSGMAGAEAAARGPLVRGAAPEALRRDRPHGARCARPSATSTSPSVVAEVRGRLTELHIDADVTGRAKHLWSIYEKMVLKGKEFDEIFDLVAIRVIVDSVKDCYAALGSIHGTWKPVVGRFKDYIAMPKFNLYQSLHTTVIGPEGKPLEVQIRTHEMHQRAEWGVAAHWSYKEGSPSDDIAWLNRIIDWQKETQRPRPVHGEPEDRPRAGRGLRLHAEGARSSPLPVGATPIDFAYSVHTEVGHACIGVTGQRAPRAARPRASSRATPARSSRRRWKAPARRATG